MSSKTAMFAMGTSKISKFSSLVECGFRTPLGLEPSPLVSKQPSCLLSFPQNFFFFFLGLIHVKLFMVPMDGGHVPCTITSTEDRRARVRPINSWALPLVGGESCRVHAIHHVFVSTINGRKRDLNSCNDLDSLLTGETQKKSHSLDVACVMYNSSRRKVPNDVESGVASKKII